MSRLPDFSPKEREFHESILRFNPESLERDLDFVGEAIVTDVTFEPFESVGSSREIFTSAANLYHFIEEYRKRTGSLELPPEA